MAPPSPVLPCAIINHMERLLNFFTPKNYQLNLTISRATEKIKGDAIITGIPHHQTIKFHAVNLSFSAVELLDQSKSSTRPLLLDQSKPSTHPLQFSHQNGILEITLPDEVKLGSPVILKIAYQTILNRNLQGCYLSTYIYQGKEQRLATTQFESHYAREAFPCIDEPAAKATFDLNLTVPDLTEQDLVLANTPCLSRQAQTFTFATTPPMSTYLLAWVIGPLHGISTTNQNGVKVSSYCALNQPLSSLEFANQTAARALEYYDQKFHEKYPLEKLDQVALPDFEAGAMENWGLVTYRESMMLADNTATLDLKRSVALTVTHELSHQWFGDLVTMEWWDDLWLNESFASVIEYYATDALYPEFNIWQDFFTGDCLAALKRDCLPGVQSVKQAVHHPAEIATLFDGAIVYAKGARLILMLMRLMGEAKFDQGICDYFAKYQYKNTIGDDLWTALQPYADFDVKTFMDAWISQPGYPVLKSTKASEWSQHRFLITGATDASRWPLPEVKDDMSGHYLLNLDDQTFATRLEQFNDLTQEERLRLLIDRKLLAKTPEVASSSLLDLLPRFATLTSASVWEILALIISDLKLFCPPETPAADHYKTYLRQLLQPQFDALDLGHLDSADDITYRDILLGIAYYSEYKSTLKSLASLYQSDFAKLPPELRTHILSAKFYFAENEVFDVWLSKYQSETDPEIKTDILYTLVDLAKHPAHLDRLLELLQQPQIVRSQDHLFLYVYLLRNYRTRTRALDWLIGNWEYVEKLTGEKSIEDYPRYTANFIRTFAEAKQFYDFFDAKSDTPVLKRTLKIAHTDIDARLRLIAADTPAVQECLAHLTASSVK